MVLSGEDAAFFLWSQENRLTVRNVPYIENILSHFGENLFGFGKKKKLLDFAGF